MSAKGSRLCRKWTSVVLASALIAGVASAAPSSHIVGLRFGGDASATRVVLDFDGPFAPPVLVRDGASRLRLELSVAPDSSSQAGRGRGLVITWSTETTARGESLRLELASAARIVRRFTLPSSSGTRTVRYVIDLTPDVPVTPTSMVHPVTPVAYQPPPPIRAVPTYEALTGAPPSYTAHATPQAVRIPAPPRVRADTGADPNTDHRLADHRLRVIVIDAGHGGHDSGALGVSRQEKDLTLAAARALRSRLERSGRYRVVLTRESDVFIPLEARVKIAREGGADLFISLHADSAGGDAAVHGASVYTLSDSGGDRVHSVLGRNEWFAKMANRADVGTSQILLDLTQRSTRNRSAVFAELLLGQLGGKVDLLPRGHRDAGYFVLLAPDVPAALLEMGFITNPEDESRLADPAQRARMMDWVADAIDAYFDEGRTIAAK